MSPSKNFTKATLTRQDKERLDALQRQLTIKAGGRAVSQAEVLNWLIELGEIELTKAGEPGQGQEGE